MPSPSPRPSVESFEFLSPDPLQSQLPFLSHNDATIRPSSTGGRYQPRRGSTASSMHSVGGTLDTGVKGNMGSLTEHNRNAISTLLQPPIIRTGMLPHTMGTAMAGYKPPSSRDIPPVTLVSIPHVEPSTFSSYLQQVGSLYDVFQRAKLQVEDVNAGPKHEPVRADEVLASFEYNSQADTPAGTPILRGSSFSPVRSPQPKRRTSGTKRAAPATTPLSTIPSIYFDENFQLGNPRTFDVVSERSEVIRQIQNRSEIDFKVANGSLEAPPATGRKALATNAILQEKLSWYLDTVEVHLIASISKASTSFFAALGSLRDLQSEASDSVARIKALRGDLRLLDEQMAVGGLKIIDMKRKRGNLEKLADSTHQLHAVITGLSLCEDTIDKGGLDEGLNRLETVERLIMGTLSMTDPSATSWIQSRCPSSLIDLRGLKALDGVFQNINQLRFRIGKGYEARFLNTLLTDLRDHVKHTASQDTLQRWALTMQRVRGDHQRIKSIVPAYVNTSEEFRSRLRASLIGLSSSDFINQASASFRDAIIKEMKLVIRRYLPSSSDDDAESMASISTRGGRGMNQQDKNSILARNLRAMDPGDAEEFFVNIFTDISEAIRRLSIQVKVLLDITSGVSSPPISESGWRSPPRSPFIGSIDHSIGVGGHRNASNGPQDELFQALDMSSLLGQAVDAAQTQVTKLLRVRSEVTTGLPLARFLRYFSLCRLFTDECEAVSGRSGSALKGAVNSQITDFVPKFGDIEKQELVEAMDSDRWEPKDFEAHDVDVLTKVLKGMTSDPSEWLEIGSVWKEIRDPILSKDTPQVNGTRKEKSKDTIPAEVDEQRYILSHSATVVLRGIERFEILLSCMPSMTAEVSTSLCDYIKLFNSRLCQLILGAGAMQSAGLKNINTKHLAIASQTMSFVIAILPYIRECARRHGSGNKNPLGEMDNVKRLLQDQQVSIHDKLIDIMSGRATMHVRNLKKVEWDSEEEVRKDVSPNMETLTSQTVTLHKVISKYLHEIQVRMIMGPVFESYREQVGKTFKEADIRTASGKQRLLRDVKLFDAKLGHIDGAGNIGTYLIQLVEAKVVASPESHKQSAEGTKHEGNAANAEQDSATDVK